MSKGIRLENSFSIPDVLEGKVAWNGPYENFNAKGLRSSFGMTLFLEELGLTKEIKSADFYLLAGKAEDTLRTWGLKYQRHLDMQHKDKRAYSVEKMNQEAVKEITSVQDILKHTLKVDDKIDWDAIKRRDSYKVKPKELLGKNLDINFIMFEANGYPKEFEFEDRPPKPNLDKVKSEYGFFSKLFKGKEIEREYEKRVGLWNDRVKDVMQENNNRERIFKKAIEDFENGKAQFEEEKKRENEAIENTKKRHAKADPIAIEEYCDLVLNRSQYPDCFPKNWVLEYRPESRMVVVEYELPSPSKFPKTESYSYIKSKDEVKTKELTQAAQKKLYESAIFQTCLRTMHEMFEADVIKAVDAIAFNGLVTSRNPATGKSETKTILSVSANRDEFIGFNLAKIDPRATFKHLKGVAASSLVDLTPIPPVITLNKSDKRFIEGRAIASELNESVNIAVMGWEDFEHLIRELFEKEFASTGGDVKITRASSDGGVDAVAFDPDPIRGGKIVIQAKRYTKTVGVAAVRDLYGTVMNEGATKGILVTTSDYGKDSYEFAKDKPITLLNGSNLLALLAKHGHRARINIAEAKKML